MRTENGQGLALGSSQPASRTIRTMALAPHHPGLLCANAPWAWQQGPRKKYPSVDGIRPARHAKTDPGRPDPLRPKVCRALPPVVRGQWSGSGGVRVRRLPWLSVESDFLTRRRE